MAEPLSNPFTEEPLRTFWSMSVARDLEAFLARDWSITASDFDADDFFGVDAAGSSDPAQWLPKYPTLASYRQEFDRQAQDFAGSEFAVDPRLALYGAITLSAPKVAGDRALIQKTFDGDLLRSDGSSEVLAWRSLFHLRCREGVWRFTGFVGYLPL